MGDLPVQEAAQVSHIGQLEGEKLTVKAHIGLSLSLSIVLHALRDKHVLTSVDHLIDLALDVAKLILLSLQLEWLSKRRELASQILDLIAVRCVLHLKVVVVLDQLLNLLLESLLVHRCKLVFKTWLTIDVDGS